MTYALFERLADRFDWHTPPHHYQHDHAFVLERLGQSRRVLDVGCGTGVFLARAVMAGFDAIGIDAAPEMVAIAAGRVGAERVHVERMQEIDEASAYDGVVSLSWSFNYVRSLAEARDVLERLFRALRSKGHLILQIAHAPNAVGGAWRRSGVGAGRSRRRCTFFVSFQFGARPAGRVAGSVRLWLQEWARSLFRGTSALCGERQQGCRSGVGGRIREYQAAGLVAWRTLRKFRQRFSASATPIAREFIGANKPSCGFLTKQSHACRLASVPVTVCSVRSCMLNQL